MRSHYYLAAAAAAISPALLAAPAAMAASTPEGVAMAPVTAGSSSGVNVGDNLCVLPFRLLGPLSTNNFPGRYRVCDHDVNEGPGDHILDNVCIAPLEIGDLPYQACDDEIAPAPSTGPISVLRNLSVLGVNVTH